MWRFNEKLTFECGVHPVITSLNMHFPNSLPIQSSDKKFSMQRSNDFTSRSMYRTLGIKSKCNGGFQPLHLLSTIGWYLLEPSRNKPQWNFNQNSYMVFQENACEHVICIMAVILTYIICEWCESDRKCDIYWPIDSLMFITFWIF